MIYNDENVPVTEWPNDPFWKALADGERVSFEDEDDVLLKVYDCGELVLPTGKVAACDPFVTLDSATTFATVPPGRYPVRVTVANLTPELPFTDPEAHLREAYATILLSDQPEVSRRAMPLEEKYDGEEFLGFGVDAGTACFVDNGCVAEGMPPVDDWLDLFDDDWFVRMDDPNHIRAGIALIPLPNSTNGANIVIVHSGWGDGVYPVVGGFDEEGNLVRLHIDFFILRGLSAPEEEEASSAPPPGSSWQYHPANIKYGFVFALLCALCQSLAYGATHLWLQILLVYISMTPAFLTLAYLTNFPRALGKNLRGQWNPINRLILFPYKILNESLLKISRVTGLVQEPVIIAPYIRLGPRLFASDGKALFNIEAVIDMTAEFEETAFLSSVPNYRCFPMLDGLAPTVGQFVEAIMTAATTATSGGTVYIHCASGHGRSVAVTAGLLVYLQRAKSIEQALEIIRKKRPRAKPTKAQLKNLQIALDHLMRE